MFQSECEGGVRIENNNYKSITNGIVYGVYVVLLYRCQIETDQMERNSVGKSKLYCMYTEVETRVLINESFERNNVERKLKYVEKKRKSMMEVDVNNLPFSFL